MLVQVARFASRAEFARNLKPWLTQLVAEYRTSERVTPSPTIFVMVAKTLQKFVDWTVGPD